MPEQPGKTYKFQVGDKVKFRKMGYGRAYGTVVEVDTVRYRNPTQPAYALDVPGEYGPWYRYEDCLELVVFAEDAWKGLINA